MVGTGQDSQFDIAVACIPEGTNRLKTVLDRHVEIVGPMDDEGRTAEVPELFSGRVCDVEGKVREVVLDPAVLIVDGHRRIAGLERRRDGGPKCGALVLSSRLGPHPRALLWSAFPPGPRPFGVEPDQAGDRPVQ